MNTACLYEALLEKKEYYDKKSKLNPEEYSQQKKNTATLYVGRIV